MPQFNEGNINSYLVPSGSLTGSLSNSGTLTGQIAIGSGSGTTDYNDLSNKPSINSVTLSGNKTTSDLNISYNDLDDKPAIPSVLNDLSDVNINNPYQTDVLSYNESTSKWINHPVSLTVEGLSNVALSTPYAGEVLKISSTSSSGTVWRSSKVNYSEINNTPTLATVATSGSYNDLTDQPTIPDLSVVDVTSSFTITKTSGAWNVASFNAYKSGTLIYIRVRFEGTGVSVSGGSNSFNGTIAGPYIPLYDSFGMGCAGNTLFIMQLQNNGTMAVRLINDAYTLASGVVAAISNLYFINP